MIKDYFDISDTVWHNLRVFTSLHVEREYRFNNMWIDNNHVFDELNNWIRRLTDHHRPQLTALECSILDCELD